MSRGNDRVETVDGDGLAAAHDEECLRGWFGFEAIGRLLGDEGGDEAGCPEEHREEYHFGLCSLLDWGRKGVDQGQCLG